MEIKLPQFDESWLKTLTKGAKTYNVVYHLFKTKRAANNINMTYIKKLTDRKVIDDAVCFSSIRYSIDKKYNALVYTLTNINLTDMSFLSTKEVRRWLKLCKRYGFIGNDVSIKFGVKHPYVVIRFDNYTKNQLYVYLCSIRYLVEWPHYVRAVLTLYDAGLPFYSAFVAASRLVIDNSVHHILTVLRHYGEHWSTHRALFDAEFDLRYLVSLKLLIFDFGKYDNHNVYNSKFSCSSVLNKLKDASYFATDITIKELFTNELKSLANTDNLEEMKSYYNEYLKNKNKYKFIIPCEKRKSEKAKKKEELVNA